MKLKPGAKLLSTACATEMIVVKAPAADVDLTIGGRPPVTLASDRPADGTIVAGYGGGTAMGKRYADAAHSIELLCTRAGYGVPAIDGQVLALKQAKPLPSSD